MHQPKIDIIGGGNLAWHLEKSFRDVADLSMINPHYPDEVRIDTDYVIVCVKDDAISDVLAGLPDVCGVVCHTSGATGLDVIPSRFEHSGVFYPLNTFTKGVTVNMRDTPIFVEASDTIVLDRLLMLGGLISDKVVQADSRQREILHIAAVLSCNYVNRLWALSDALLTENGLDFDVMKPLITSTYQKMLDNHPADVQTGPAIRRDMKTITRHINRLSGTHLIEIYRVLANNILDKKI